jgi:phosphate starvation-inducible PhoH-like protein
LTFCVGPAGTGKTYLAVVLAAQALLANQYERLILTRPAVEAGEKLGFLPGDLQQKINPYLRPLYDALYELIDPEKVPSLMERGVIEVAPLAYMRGRTLSNAFVIVDEAQNTTPAQMKMVLTRLGFRSRMVVTGDITQTDLPPNQQSGLAVAQKILIPLKALPFANLRLKMLSAIPSFSESSPLTNSMSNREWENGNEV